MTMDISTFLGIAAAAFSIVGGAYAAYRHIKYGIAYKKEKERQSILDQAGQEMSKIRTELDEKITRLEEGLENQKANVSKDLSHLKEIYNAELKVLSTKIDELRSDIQVQHASMVGLLMKLVDAK